ncbi:MAG: DUF2817 domain-containing protein [Candidatus Gastranaerophilaceae bacterium]
MKTLKKIHSKNKNEIVLIEQKGTKNLKTVLIIGVVHGDEPQGKFLIENYLENSKNKSSGLPENRMLLIPCLNPDGLALGTRQNANLVDINRNFPTQNWQNAPFTPEYFGGEKCFSEIETKFVMKILEKFSPDVIFTLHTPFKVVNYDGPAKDIAKRISEIIKYPVKKQIGYPTPGSFGTYAGIERKIPIITLELDEEIDVKELVAPMNKIFDYLGNV